MRKRGNKYVKIRWKGDHQYSIHVVLNAPRREAVAVYMIDGSVRCVISKMLQLKSVLYLVQDWVVRQLTRTHLQSL